MDAVKRLFQVNEIDVQRCVPLFALFQNLAQSEDVIRAVIFSTAYLVALLSLFCDQVCNDFKQEQMLK